MFVRRGCAVFHDIAFPIFSTMGYRKQAIFAESTVEICQKGTPCKIGLLFRPFSVPCSEISTTFFLESGII